MPSLFDPDRRDVLIGSAATALFGLLNTPLAAEPVAPRKGDPFRYCLNTSTIRGQKLGIVDEIELAAKAGYQGIEPWINELDQYAKDGGNLNDLGKRIADLGLKVESAIGFAAFLHPDEATRKAGLEEAKRCMELVRTIGGTRIAAPPVGLVDQTGLNLFDLGERFGALIQVGRQEGVLPQLELWGFSKTLSRLGEVAFVATESRQWDALLLLDVYHIYKGGSDFSGLRLLNGQRMECFHINDYPSDPPRETIKDENRVYPGDGVAPLDKILQTLVETGFRGALSLELFNRNYWEQDAFEVAKTGLEKTRVAVAKALNL